MVKGKRAVASASGFVLVVWLPSLACVGSRGLVHVGQPQVHTRERLIAERQSRAEWLRKELAETEKIDPSYQGLRDLRAFSGTYASLRAAIDPAKGDLAEAENDNEKLLLDAEKWRLKKAALEARQDYEEAAMSLGGGTGSTTPQAESPAGGASDVQPPAPPKATEPFSVDRELIKASEAETTKAEAHPRDVFLDRLAMRNLVEAEMRTSQFDDSHDITGGTLYELTLDVSVLPGDWSSEFVEVEVYIDLPQSREEELEEFYPYWQLALRSSILEDVERIVGDLRREAVGKTHPTLDWLKSYYATKVIPDESRSAELLDELLAATDELGFSEALAMTPQGKEALQQQSLQPIQDKQFRAFMQTRDPAWLDPSWLSIDSVAEKLRKDAKKPASSLNLESPDDWQESVTRAVIHQHRYAFEGIVVLEAEGSNVIVSEPGAVAVNTKTRQIDRDGTSAPSGTDTVLLGRKEFARRLKNAESKGLQSYAVQPKELAQNISDVSARETIVDMVAAIQAVLAEKGISAEGQFQHLEKVQERLHAILRQPLLIGYSRGRPKNDGAQVGWVIGPKLELRDGEAEFLHAPVRHDVSAEVAIPAWVDRIELAGCYHWLHRRGGRATSTKLWGGETVTVPLPRPDDLYEQCTKALLNDFAINSDIRFLGASRRPEPEIEYPTPDAQSPVTVLAGKDRSILLLGTNVWRSPQVFLGNQRATRVDVLSSMNGLLAHFDYLEYPGKPQSDPRNAPAVPVTMTLVTTYGHDSVDGIVILADPRLQASPLAKPAVLKTRYLVLGPSPELEFEYVRPGAYDRMETRFTLGSAAPAVFTAARWESGTNETKMLVLCTPTASWPGAQDQPRVVEVQLLRVDREGEPGERVTPEASPKLALFPAEKDRAFAASSAAAPDITITRDKAGNVDTAALRFSIAADHRGVFDVAYPGLLASAQEKRIFLLIGPDDVKVAVDSVETSAGRFTLGVSPAPVQQAFSALLKYAPDFRSVRLGYEGPEGKALEIPIVHGTTGVRVKIASTNSEVKAKAIQPNVSVTPRKRIEDPVLELTGTEGDFKANFADFDRPAMLFLSFDVLSEPLELRHAGPTASGGHKFTIVAGESDAGRPLVELLLAKVGADQAFTVLYGKERRTVPVDTTASKLKFTARAPAKLTLASTELKKVENARLLFQIAEDQVKDLPRDPVEAAKVIVTLSRTAISYEVTFDARWEKRVGGWDLVAPVPDEVFEKTDADGEQFAIRLVFGTDILESSSAQVLVKL